MHEAAVLAIVAVLVLKWVQLLLKKGKDGGVKTGIEGRCGCVPQLGSDEGEEVSQTVTGLCQWPSWRWLRARTAALN